MCAMQTVSACVIFGCCDAIFALPAFPPPQEIKVEARNSHWPNVQSDALLDGAFVAEWR